MVHAAGHVGRGSFCHCHILSDWELTLATYKRKGGGEGGETERAKITQTGDFPALPLTSAHSVQ